MFEKHLLVAVVDTEAGRNAARQAVRLAASSGSKLSAVSVMPGLEGDMDRLYVPDVQNALASPHLQALRELRALAQESGLHVETALRHGQSHEQIVDQAEALGADVIILGESRRGALERALVGPTASRVIGYSRGDVLVIPNGAQIGFKTILLALDDSENSLPAAHRALALARQYGSRLWAVTVLQVHAESSVLESYVDALAGKAELVLEDFAAMAEGEDMQVETVVEQGLDVAAALVAQAREHDAELIVMGSHGRTGLRRLLMGSVAENVLAQSPCPVLIVH